MLTLVANHKGSWVHYWAGKGHAQNIQLLGHIWSPGGTITVYPHLPYVLDNGVYAVEENGGTWSGEQFLRHCDQIYRLPKPPLWITMPDRRCNAAETLRLWHQWEPHLRRYQVPLAFVIQDGIEFSDVPDTAQVLFVGGSDSFRYPKLKEIVAFGRATQRPVHVGRVNGNRIWQCHEAGVASQDGSGWFRGDLKQLAKLENYLDVQLGNAEMPHHHQIGLFTGASEHQSYFAHFQPQASAHAVQESNERATGTIAGATIPVNITREHLIRTIGNWQSWGSVPTQQMPKRYAVRYENALYPIKLLIARANLYVNGYVLCPRSFSGGIRSANRFLLSRGFDVVSLV